MMSGTIVKAIGIGATLVGAGATLVTSWVDERKMEEMIDAKVNEALEKREEGEES